MVDNDQEGMADRDGGLLSSAPNEETLILSREGRILAVNGGMSGFHQGRAQPGTAFTRLTRKAFACADREALAHAGPRSQMAGTWEAAHVRSNLSQNHSARRRLMPGIVESR